MYIYKIRIDEIKNLPIQNIEKLISPEWQQRHLLSSPLHDWLSTNTWEVGQMLHNGKVLRAAVPDGVLGLQAVQEGRGEVVQVLSKPFISRTI